jgi:hypothetical protein
MKCFIFVLAVVALVSAAEEKKPKQEEAEKKPAAPVAAAAADDERRGLVWPLPDPISEGDLMLHGSISYDRVRALYKNKLEDDVDRMVLAHGRSFLRRVSKFFDDNAEFKIMPVLCKDQRNMNATNNRWRIEIPKQAAPAEEKQQEIAERDQPIPQKEIQNDNITNENVTTTFAVENATTTIAPSSSAAPLSTSAAPLSTDKPSEKPTEKPSEKPTDKPLTTTVKPVEPVKPEESFEVRRREFYRQVGANFARLLMKEFRKEALISEESDYLARWIADEAVHYGAFAIYCNEGENVKEIKKQLAVFLEEKP